MEQRGEYVYSVQNLKDAINNKEYLIAAKMANSMPNCWEREYYLAICELNFKDFERSKQHYINALGFLDNEFIQYDRRGFLTNWGISVVNERMGLKEEALEAYKYLEENYNSPEYHLDNIHLNLIIAEIERDTKRLGEVIKSFPTPFGDTYKHKRLEEKLEDLAKNSKDELIVEIANKGLDRIRKSIA